MTRVVTQKSYETLAINIGEKVYKDFWGKLRPTPKNTQKQAVHLSQQPRIFGMYNR